MRSRVISLGAVVCVFALSLKADPPKEPVRSPVDQTKQGASNSVDEHRISVTEAKERAKLLHQVYSASLDMLHHHYFRRELPVLPARALEDVFAELDEQSKIKTRWIAVNTPAMSINHNPESEFEKKAAEVIASGKAEYDRVEDGYYKRAGVIPLRAGCVGCHTKLFQATAKTPRFAGLVIAIPVKDK